VGVAGALERRLAESGKPSMSTKSNAELKPQGEREEEARRLRELMRRYQEGDHQAAELLVLELRSTLARYMYATSLGAMNVDDLLQECWLRIHKARSSYRPEEPVLPWVLAIARHTRIDFYRRWRRSSARETELFDFSNETLGTMAGAEGQAMEAQSFLGLMEQLPESQREVVVMMKVTGMSVQEIAAATKSTPAAIKQKAYRAYRKLRQVMAGGE
jgi:RNA polymerase sigma-70 factor, ECF subfamily